MGDDPSFKAMREIGGPLTWGVCRQDVRNRVRTGDIVVFISCHRSKVTRSSEYRLCSIATVERKIRQSDVWLDDSLRKFSRYSNLLVKPSHSGRGWDHFEPPFNGPHGHSDWFWRIANYAGLKKDDFKQIHSTNRYEPGTRIRGRTIEIACNYVIFSSNNAETVVLADPPVVASRREGQPFESWKSDRLSNEIKKLTLGMAERSSNRKRWLRTGNTPQPHRHIVFELPRGDAENWRADFFKLIGKQ